MVQIIWYSLLRPELQYRGHPSGHRFVEENEDERYGNGDGDVGPN